MIDEYRKLIDNYNNYIRNIVAYKEDTDEVKLACCCPLCLNFYVLEIRPNITSYSLILFCHCNCRNCATEILMSLSRYETASNIVKHVIQQLHYKMQVSEEDLIKHYSKGNV